MGLPIYTVSMSNNQLRYVIVAGLFAVPFVPFIVSSSLFFPFITGKAFVFRLIVEIILACYLILAVRDENYRPKFTWILGAITLFLIIMGLATIFAENPSKAFWSNYERMEGFVTLLHLGAYFLVLGSVLKTREIWNGLLATTVGASAMMAIYSFFQIAGKVTINQGGVRVDGTLGNAGYLGIYMVFHIFFAGLLMMRFRALWQRVLLAVIALMNMIVLYNTATRGAVLGLLGGILVTFAYLALKTEKGELAQSEVGEVKKIRRIAGAGIAVLIVLVGIFWSVKDTTYVKTNPVLSRFATLSFSEIKTQGRYFVWPMAVKGFAEKPILGWGQEGFNFVFNKNYDPRMYNQEPWFDRAHNTYLDWLIAGGALGLISYLFIIASLVYYVFKSEYLDKKDRAIILGLISAYLFNNLFVFDQTSSYILFFTVLAYIHSVAPETSFGLWNKISSKSRAILESEKSKPIIEALVVIIMAGVVYFIIYSPWQQNKSLMAVLILNNQGTVGTIENYTKPFSGSRLGFPESLEHISQTALSVSTNQNASTELKQELFDEVDKAFNKQIDRIPNDARYRIFYGTFLSRFGWYGRAIEQLNEAQKLSPKKQSIYFELVSNLLMDGKLPEAVEAAKTAYELEPSYEEAGFVYGLSLLASRDFVLANEIMQGIPESRLIFDDRYISVLVSIQMYDEVINIAKKRIELDPTDLQHQITLTAAYLQVGRRAEAIQTLNEIIKLDPSFKERGEYYINEIREGRNP